MFKAEGGNDQEAQVETRQDQDTKRDTGKGRGDRKKTIKPFNQQSRILSGLMSANAGGDYLNKMFSKLEKAYDNTVAGYQVTLLKLPKEDTPLRWSAIVVAVNANDDKNRVAYFTLVLAATGDEYPRVADIDSASFLNQQMRRPKLKDFIIVPADSMDSVMTNIVEESLLLALPVSNPELLPVDGMVIPADFDPEDKEDVKAVAANALNATTIELVTTTPDWTDFSVDDIMSEVVENNRGRHDGDNTTLALVIGTEYGTGHDLVGQPYRYDWNIRLEEKRKFGSLETVNDGALNQNQATMFGFTDAVPTAIRREVSYGQSIEDIRFMPHIIVDSVQPKYYTPAWLLASLTTVTGLARNDLWLNTFHPDPTDESKDPGALNYLAGIGVEPGEPPKRIDFDTTANPADINAALKALFLDRPIISMDMTVYGPETWFTALLSEVETDIISDSSSNPAARYLFKVLNELTNGIYGDIAPKESLFATTHYIPAGIYQGDNETRDIRDIGTVEMSNHLGANNVDVLNEWVDANAALLDGDTSGIPMMTMIEILKMVVPSAKITGYHKRMTFNPVILEALERSIIECGFEVDLDATAVVRGIQRFTDRGQYLERSALSLSGNGFFTRRSNRGTFTPYFRRPGGNRRRW